jgi:hypothetical protein
MALAVPHSQHDEGFSPEVAPPQIRTKSRADKRAKAKVVNFNVGMAEAMSYPNRDSLPRP